MAGETSRESLNIVATHPLQTREWEEFRKRWGNEVIRLPFGLITLHRIPFTPYKIGMFIKGPVPTAKMLTKLKDIGRKYNLIFIKLEPNYVPGTRQQALGIRKLLTKNDCVK